MAQTNPRSTLGYRSGCWPGAADTTWPPMLYLAAALQIWVANQSEKVRPDAVAPAAVAAPRIRLAAAGGECAGAQLVVKGPAPALSVATLASVATVASVYRV